MIQPSSQRDPIVQNFGRGPTTSQFSFVQACCPLEHWQELQVVLQLEPSWHVTREDEAPPLLLDDEGLFVGLGTGGGGGLLGIAGFPRLGRNPLFVFVEVGLLTFVELLLPDEVVPVNILIKY